MQKNEFLNFLKTIKTIDVNQIAMLFHSLIVNHFEIHNPYIIGLLSSLLIYIITTISKMKFYTVFKNDTNKTNSVGQLMNFIDRLMYQIYQKQIQPPFDEVCRIPKKSIVILEDIDCVDMSNKRIVEDDKNDKNDNQLHQLLQKNDSDKLTLNTILNFIDGVEENDYIFIMTSNHPENLDPALTRAGRFDFSMELTNCTKDMFIDILKYYCYYTFKESDIDFPEYQYSTAFIINLCFTNRTDTAAIFKTLNEKK